MRTCLTRTCGTRGVSPAAATPPSVGALLKRGSRRQRFVGCAAALGAVSAVSLLIGFVLGQVTLANVSMLYLIAVTDTVFHGRKGQLRQPYREGMEDQLGALGLVVNVMVLWTTLYMDRALAQLRGQGATVNDEDVARLSPLGTNHINVLGRYHFSLPDSIARGEFRSLRDPTDLALY
jgi:Tn3 transposase DDE domain